MKRHRELTDQDIEHVAAEVWSLAEDGPVPIVEIAQGSRVDDVSAPIDTMVRDGRIERTGATGDVVRLTDAGQDFARGVVRRHRLAELLFSTVLEVEDETVVEGTACVMEHVLSPAVADSVCAFLGHPRFCPHGKPIPPGRCCRSFSNAVEPLVQPLDRMPVGSEARVVYIVPRDPERLANLSNLGLVPGATVHLRQKSPAAILAIGETTVAIELAVAREIYVKRVG